MQKYIVEWSHEFLAETPEEAAKEAFQIITDAYSEPLSVDVKDMAGNVVRIYEDEVTVEED